MQQTFQVSPVDILRINCKIKGNNEVKKITQISELTYQIYMDSENYL
jgi:hypothetical protein